MALWFWQQDVHQRPFPVVFVFPSTRRFISSSNNCPYHIYAAWRPPLAVVPCTFIKVHWSLSVQVCVCVCVCCSYWAIHTQLNWVKRTSPGINFLSHWFFSSVLPAFEIEFQPSCFCLHDHGGFKLDRNALSVVSLCHSQFKNPSESGLATKFSDAIEAIDVFTCFSPPPPVRSSTVFRPAMNLSSIIIITVDEIHLSIRLNYLRTRHCQKYVKFVSVCVCAFLSFLATGSCVLSNCKDSSVLSSIEKQRSCLPVHFCVSRRWVLKEPFFSSRWKKMFILCCLCKVYRLRSTARLISSSRNSCF